MNKIDWSGELEAYHEDGRVVPVTLANGYPDSHGDYRTKKSPAGDANEWWYSTGESRCNPEWRIRNRQPAANDRLARLEAFVARVASGGQMLALGYYDEAKALVAEIAPVDPDEAEAEKIWQSVGYTNIGPAHDVRKVAIAAIKRGRTLERGES